MDPRARILIVGQAPGRRVHETGIPFNDPSGDRLREWLGVTRATFYDASQIALVPMGFCFPGTGRAGDLPPRPECAPAWREELLGHLGAVQLTVVLGAYAVAYHLPGAKRSVTDVVRDWESRWPALVPLPHPSPRNRRWVTNNPWFEAELLPRLRGRVRDVLGPTQPTAERRRATS
ncbi:MAG: uracil-DNA glycosylase family protein [Gemmatimonadaceae bacterium]|nr:uracil-DNA glycosylase family protein [Gemmatimonadaceae bacterium]